MGRLGYFLGGAAAGIVGLFGAAWLHEEYQMFKWRCCSCRWRTTSESPDKTTETASDGSNAATTEATAETASA